ncbi:MAG: response regulator transcription factor [Bacteroidota bacterium]
MKKIKVIVTDDHELIIAGIEKLLSDSENIEMIAGLNSGKQLLEFLQNHIPDIILMDIDMPEMNGFETTKAVLLNFPEIEIIALTVAGDPTSVRKSREAGMSGYLLKNVSKEELKIAIEYVHSGKSYYSSDITEKLLSEELKSVKNENIAILTNREIEIIQLISNGYSNTQIGAKLYISHRTVDTHRTNIMKKIEVNNIAGIVKYAITNGLI